MPRELRVALVGFGNVGRRFVGLLHGPYLEALERADLKLRVTGIATAHHGIAIDRRGLDLAACLDVAHSGAGLDGLHRGDPVASSLRFVTTVPADALVEITPLDPLRGEPATSHCRIALRRGMHVVTANKGPVAFAHGPLKSLAERQNRQFLHEGAVMDGTPVFSLVERCLPGARVLGFRGTLNSTTNHVLERMEEGASRDQAVREMQEQGIAEADPSLDLDGWDLAVKGCALANALLGGSLKPADVGREGLARVGPVEVAQARREGCRLRLVVRGEGRGRRVQVRVGPERIALGDPLAGPGSDAVLLLETDLMGEIGIIERGGNVGQTAYALLADLLTIARGRKA